MCLQARVTNLNACWWRICLPRVVMVTILCHEPVTDLCHEPVLVADHCHEAVLVTDMCRDDMSQSWSLTGVVRQSWSPTCVVTTRASHGHWPVTCGSLCHHLVSWWHEPVLVDDQRREAVLVTILSWWHEPVMVTDQCHEAVLVTILSWWHEPVLVADWRRDAFLVTDLSRNNVSQSLSLTSVMRQSWSPSCHDDMSQSWSPTGVVMHSWSPTLVVTTWVSHCHWVLWGSLSHHPVS